MCNIIIRGDFGCLLVRDIHVHRTSVIGRFADSVGTRENGLGYCERNNFHAVKSSNNLIIENAHDATQEQAMVLSPFSIIITSRETSANSDHCSFASNLKIEASSRRLHRHINETRIRQQSKGIDLISNHKYQFKEMLEMTIRESNDLK